MRSLFKPHKVIIGMVHVKALPGFPNSLNDMKEITRLAVNDACALERGGVDGLIVENIFCRPRQKTVGPETVAPMAIIGQKVVEAVHIPVGIKVLFNDAEAEIAIANATGMKFVRLSVYVDVSVTMAGLIEGCAWQAISFRKRLGAEHIKILADVHVKHAAPLALPELRPIEHSAYDATHSGMADGVVVTGYRTGLAASVSDVDAVKKTVDGKLVLVGSGATEDNIVDILRHADGAIVGTHFKVNGVIENPVDERRVNTLVSHVRAAEGGGT